MADCSKNASSTGCNCCASQELVINGETIGKNHPRLLIPELCAAWYHEGGMTGTGGGMTIRQGCVG